MEVNTLKTTVVFLRPFSLPSLNEMLPAGEYDLETELSSPPDHQNPDAWKASVLVQLHPRLSHPGLERSLTVSLADLDRAQARDKLTGKELSQVFLEEMLSDPMVRLVMEADGVSEVQLRYLYSSARSAQSDVLILDCKSNDGNLRTQKREVLAIQNAENEGMPMLPVTSTNPA